MLPLRESSLTPLVARIEIISEINSSLQRPHDVDRRSFLGNNAATVAAVSTFGLKLGGDSLFLRGGERLVNDGVKEGEEVHCNQVCCRRGGVCSLRDLEEGKR